MGLRLKISKESARNAIGIRPLLSCNGSRGNAQKIPPKGQVISANLQQLPLSMSKFDTRKIMKLNRLHRPSFIRLGIAEALIVILTVVLYLPVAFARHRGARGDFGVLRVTGTSDVTFSGIRVENGKAAARGDRK